MGKVSVPSFTAAILIVCSSILLFAQGPPSLPCPLADIASPPEWSKEDAVETATIEDTLRAFDRTISENAGGTLDRKKLNALFVPGGRIVVALPPQPGRARDVAILSPDQYAEGSDANTMDSEFIDVDLGKQVQRFGVMAHVYSTYASRSRQTDGRPRVRGIRSFELFHREDGWRIVQVYWETERAGQPIPQRYLENDGR